MLPAVPSPSHGFGKIHSSLVVTPWSLGGDDTTIGVTWARDVNQLRISFSLVPPLGSVRDSGWTWREGWDCFSAWHHEKVNTGSSFNWWEATWSLPLLTLGYSVDLQSKVILWQTSGQSKSPNVPFSESPDSLLTPPHAATCHTAHRAPSSAQSCRCGPLLRSLGSNTQKEESNVRRRNNYFLGLHSYFQASSSCGEVL